MPIEAVIFDFNGVIMDDEHVHEQATRRVLEQYSISLAPKQYLEMCMGKADPSMFASLIELFSITDATPANLVDRKNTFYLAHLHEARSVPGVIDLIARIKPLFCLGIASGARREEIIAHLSRLQLDPSHFHAIVSSDDTPKSKPDPEPYLLAAKALGVSPRRCAAIEDTQTGVMAAKAAGLYCVGFHNPSYTRNGHAQNLALADLEISDLRTIDASLLLRVDRISSAF